MEEVSEKFVITYDNVKELLQPSDKAIICLFAEAMRIETQDNIDRYRESFPADSPLFVEGQIRHWQSMLAAFKLIKYRCGNTERSAINGNDKPF